MLELEVKFIIFFMPSPTWALNLGDSDLSV